MGEEAKLESTKSESDREEKPAEEKQEQKNAEEKKEPKPPSPCVLFIELHCVGCAKKIRKYIMKMRGVEGVMIDMVKNEVTIKGIVEPQAICNMITKKTKKRAQVISPPPETEGEPIPEVVTSQIFSFKENSDGKAKINRVSGPVTLELNVNMQCEACADQLKGKILKMRGVQTAATEHSTGKVIVTGTMDASKLVEYVYKRTKKQAKIVSQSEPQLKEEEENKELAEKPGAEEAKVEGEKKDEEEKAEEEPNKEEGDNDENKNKEEKEAKQEGDIGDENEEVLNVNEEWTRRNMMYYYQPIYMIERIPPPQLFSDENPNACCVS